MSANEQGPIHVVAGVITDAAGRVLIARRPSGKHLAGGWEFPGGKLEVNETRLEGLARELAEEIGIALRSAHPLIRIRHVYPERCIDLDVWRVTAYECQPRSVEGQPVRWCARDDLLESGLVPADRPIATALLLPERITSEEGLDYGVWPAAHPRRLTGRFCTDSAQATAAAAAGADFLLASTLLDPAAITEFAAGLNVPVYVRGVPLEAAWECGASGIHTLDARG